jgi:hypothetical protein
LAPERHNNRLPGLRKHGGPGLGRSRRGIKHLDSFEWVTMAGHPLKSQAVNGLRRIAR